MSHFSFGIKTPPRNRKLLKSALTAHCCQSGCFSLYRAVFSAVLYRNDVSCFDIEARQVVVVAVIFQGANLQSCWSIWQTRTDSKSDGNRDKRVSFNVQLCRMKSAHHANNSGGAVVTGGVCIASASTLRLSSLTGQFVAVKMSAGSQVALNHYYVCRVTISSCVFIFFKAS